MIRHLTFSRSLTILRTELRFGILEGVHGWGGLPLSPFLLDGGHYLGRGGCKLPLGTLGTLLGGGRWLLGGQVLGASIQTSPSSGRRSGSGSCRGIAEVCKGMSGGHTFIDSARSSCRCRDTRLSFSAIGADVAFRAIRAIAADALELFGAISVGATEGRKSDPSQSKQSLKSPISPHSSPWRFAIWFVQ